MIAVSITAALVVLLVMYCGIKDNPNLLSLLMLALPVFAVVGALAGLVYGWHEVRAYDKAKR